MRLYTWLNRLFPRSFTAKMFLLAFLGIHLPLIALIACHFGLRIQPNTESLGRGTTTSVVTSITGVILLDALYAVIFSSVGI